MRAIELFAGVGGFHLGLEQSNWEVVWANQFEPSTPRTQHAYEIYCRHFKELASKNAVSKEDIADVAAEAETSIPPHELLVGGFPCQDYSVAKPLPKATGLGGKKGVLWWEIFRILRAKRPPMVVLENVDRLLSSPASHRGRDFAIMLACFDSLGYTVEWRVVVADDYGFPQRRRRVFIAARLEEQPLKEQDMWERLSESGIMTRTFPIHRDQLTSPGAFRLPKHEPLPPPNQKTRFETAVRAWVYRVGEWERLNPKASPFKNAGVMSNGHVVTEKVVPKKTRLNVTKSGRPRPWKLGQVVRKTSKIPVEFLIPLEKKHLWEEHKGAKSLERTKGYFYSEGGMSCPDDRGRASRTIITSEGGTSPSRFKHIVGIEKSDHVKAIILRDGTEVAYDQFMATEGPSYRDTADPESKVWRRLLPEELEELNGFPRRWTRMALDGTGAVSDTRRAFLMGNALVVGVVAAIADTMMHDWQG